jgi:hypothetical protein
MRDRYRTVRQPARKSRNAPIAVEGSGISTYTLPVYATRPVRAAPCPARLLGPDRANCAGPNRYT